MSVQALRATLSQRLLALSDRAARLSGRGFEDA